METILNKKYIKNAIKKELEYDSLVGSTINEDTSEEDFRRQEYNIILDKKESHELKMKEYDIIDYGDLSAYFDRIIMINRETILYYKLTIFIKKRMLLLEDFAIIQEVVNRLGPESSSVKKIKRFLQMAKR